jgi:hypothetical protein
MEFNRPTVIEDFSGQLLDECFYEIYVDKYLCEAARLQQKGFTLFGEDAYSNGEYVAPWLQSCPTYVDGWRCELDPEHRWGGWTEFRDPWLYWPPTEPEIDFLPCEGSGGAEVVGERLADALKKWGLREVSPIRFEEELTDAGKPLSKKRYYWLRTTGVIRQRPPKVFGGPNACETCGWGPVVCPACGAVEHYYCPGCDSLLISSPNAEWSKGEPQLMWETWPGRHWTEVVLLGKTWNGGDYMGGRGPRVISRRLFDRLREFGAKPFVWRSVPVDVEEMTDEQWKMMEER